MGYFYVIVFLITLIAIYVYTNKNTFFGLKSSFRHKYHINRRYHESEVKKIISAFQSENSEIFIKEDYDRVQGKIKFEVIIEQHKECSLLVRIFFREASIEISIISRSSSGNISKKQYEKRKNVIEKLLSKFDCVESF